MSPIGRLRVTIAAARECMYASRCVCLKENEAMSGIQFVTDEKGRKFAVQIGLKRYGSVLEDF